MTLKLILYFCTTEYFNKNSTTSQRPTVKTGRCSFQKFTVNYSDNYNSLIKRYYVNKPINLNYHNQIFPLKCTDNHHNNGL